MEPKPITGILDRLSITLSMLSHVDISQKNRGRYNNLAQSQIRLLQSIIGGLDGK